MAAPVARARKDKHAGMRRMVVLQTLMMQGILALVLVVMMLFSLGDTRWVAVYGAALIVPVGWSVVVLRAFGRDERARREGTWTKEWGQKERSRAYGWMGGLLVGAIVLMAALLMFL